MRNKCKVIAEIIKARRTDYMIQEVSLSVLYHPMSNENTRTWGSSAAQFLTVKVYGMEKTFLQVEKKLYSSTL